MQEEITPQGHIAGDGNGLGPVETIESLKEENRELKALLREKEKDLKLQFNEHIREIKEKELKIKNLEKKNKEAHDRI